MALYASSATLTAKAQSSSASAQGSPLLRVNSAFVWVPALVRTDRGEILSNPDANGLRLFDNDTPEKVTEINTKGLPVSLVILMQTGGSASRFLASYANLTKLGPWVGNPVHEITLVTFDSRIRQIWSFPARTDGVDYALTHLHSGDQGAAIKDAVAFGVRQLQGEPGRFRRVVLLLSQESDAGSSTSSQSLLEELGISSTVVYCLTFSGEKTNAERAHAKKPAGGVDERLEVTSRALDQRTAGEIAFLTGGTEFQFDDQRDFNSAMLETISAFHNGITLGFQPSGHEAGLHLIDVQADSRKLRVTARRAYWLAGPE
jgi:hypothetical protein